MYYCSEPRTVTLIPGDGIGPEIAAAVQRIFAAAEAPISWEPVDVTPVKNADGTMGIPQAVIESVNRNKIGLKSPLMTPVGKGFRFWTRIVSSTNKLFSIFLSLNSKMLRCIKR